MFPYTGSYIRLQYLSDMPYDTSIRDIPTFKKHEPLPLPLRQILVQSTTILHSTSDRRRLNIVEALLIKNEKPTLNKINFGVGHNVLQLFNN